MKIFKKLTIVTFALLTSFVLVGSDELMNDKTQSYENIEDSNLNTRLVNLKFNIQQQRAGILEATDMFKKVFPDVIEGKALVKNLHFEQGDTSLVVTDSPIPLKILFRGQFLLDNPQLSEKAGKVIKFRISTADLVEEPILAPLRKPLTDSSYWLHLTFSNYGKGAAGDYVDNLKPDTIKY